MLAGRAIAGDAAGHRRLRAAVAADHDVRPELPPGAAEAAASVAAGATAVGLRELADVAHSDQPDRGGGERRDAAADSLHAAARPRDRPHVRRRARETLLGFFRSLGEAMLVLVRWVVWLAPIGVFALMLPLGAHGGAGLAGAIGFLHRWPIRSRSVVVRAAALSGGRGRRADSDARLRARGAAGATDCVLVELVDRVAAGAGAKARSEARVCRRT